MYHKYYHGDDEEENIPHYGLIVCNSENCTKLIETGMDGYIRIWNFHTGNLLMSIKAGIPVIPGNISKIIKIIELKNGNIIKTINDDNITTIKKIQHPQFGECLIIQGSGRSTIKLLKIHI